MSDTQVLIVGAGPTGLVLALFLTRLGVRVRIVDKTAEPGSTSRALVVHARTLEFYRQIGLADAVVQRGLEFTAANLWASGRHVGRIQFGEIGRGVSAFPYMLVFPQDEHEPLLIDALAKLGVTVERPTELVSLTNGADGVRAKLKRADGTDETCDALYVAGCDGARSRVRESLGVGFPGGTYEHLFYVADVEVSGPVINGELHVALDEADFLAVFPLKGQRRSRLIGTVRDELAAKRERLTWSDVSSRVVDRMGITVEKVHWFSTYHVHHRVADRFRAGRAFLLGDAAHIHSPVGGQGMNTGIGDAVNLAWKLAGVMAGRADSRLLDTYQPERMAFAQRLVATTDRAFTIVTKNGPIARRVRVNVFPHVIPQLFTVDRVRRFMFRTVSQTALHYRGSALSAGKAGSVHAGDRLPWVELDNITRRAEDNYAPLASLEWQVHVYGAASQAVQAICRERGIAVHEFAWSAGAEGAGFERDAVYLVRPDGHVAFAATKSASEELKSYLEDWMIRNQATMSKL
jgi:2-polyprenyl-6-methoxyphenol hydroxylase-like FAD-dependent oxidoreductase